MSSVEDLCRKESSTQLFSPQVVERHDNVANSVRNCTLYGSYGQTRELLEAFRERLGMVASIANLTKQHHNMAACVKGKDTYMYGLSEH